MTARAALRTMTVASVRADLLREVAAAGPRTLPQVVRDLYDLPGDAVAGSLIDDALRGLLSRGALAYTPETPPRLRLTKEGDRTMANPPKTPLRECCPTCGRVLPLPASPAKKAKMAATLARESARFNALVARAKGAGVDVGAVLSEAPVAPKPAPAKR